MVDPVPCALYRSMQQLPAPPDVNGVITLLPSDYNVILGLGLQANHRTAPHRMCEIAASLRLHSAARVW